MDALTLNLVSKVEPARPAKASPPASAHPDKAPAPAAPSAESQSSEAVRQAASELEMRLGVKVELGQDESTGRIVVRIFNQEGDRLLRQIPAETILRMLDRFKAGAEQGLLGLQV